MQAAGLAVIPAFAGGLDGRPAIDAYFTGGRIDALVSLTGFSLIGGPAYNDSAAAVEVLKGLDVPYIAAHPLEFQTLGQWAESTGGLGPVETTMLVALPEIDGATNPTVFGGRHGPDGCHGCSLNVPARLRQQGDGALPRTDRQPCRKDPSHGAFAAQGECREKGGHCPLRLSAQCGAIGTAAYLSVFEACSTR
jgi:magnesium chelatase subunit H